MDGRSLPDPYLILVDPKGKVVEKDDNGGGGKDAEINNARLKKTGTYTIEATARGRSHRGSYRLRLSQ